MLGAAVLGYMLAWFLQPVGGEGKGNSNYQPTDGGHGDGQGNGNGNGNGNGTAMDAEKAQKELEKMKKRYDELYENKLDVDTALMAAESTLDGLKLDYERLERDMSGNNNRQKEIQADFERYKDKKESEIKELRTKAKSAAENYEAVKFQLAKSSRINEKLQESLSQLKEENDKLSTELKEAKEEIEVVNASMAELKADYKDVKEKAETYNEKLAAWHEKYKSLDLSYQKAEDEKKEISDAYQSYQISTASEIEKLSGHLKSLQTQLEETASYTQEYADAYSEAETERQRLESEIEQQRIEAAKELAEIQKHLKTLEYDYESIQKREEILDRRYGSLQEKHGDLEEAYKNTVEEKQNLEVAYHEYKKTTSEQFEELEKEAKNWVEKFEASNYELSQHKEKAAELEENKKQLVLELEKTRQRYQKEMSVSGGEFDALNDTFEDLKQRYFDLNKELSSTKLEKEKIDHQQEIFQGEVLAELQVVRGENKMLSKTLATIKAEKKMLEYSKEELLERVKELEENGNNALLGQGQDKLVKIINRLQKTLEQHQEEISQFRKEKELYEQKIANLESNLAAAKTIVKTSESSSQQDDLKRIKGLDAPTEETLNDFGIYTFEQLANISLDNKELLCQVLSAHPQKVEKWIKQAGYYIGKKSS